MAPIVHLSFTDTYIDIYNMNLDLGFGESDLGDPYSASKFFFSGWSRSYFCYQVFGMGPEVPFGMLQDSSHHQDDHNF